jgi:iron-sulfur cluster insertion protein
MYKSGMARGSNPMNDTATAVTTDITFSDAAASKVRRLISEENNPNLKLRIFISGGGCSGFQYGFQFDENVAEGDVTVVNGDVALVIDPLSYQYLVGAEVDYTEGLQGSQFIVRNPNATTTCGCGSSFSV